MWHLLGRHIIPSVTIPLMLTQVSACIFSRYNDSVVFTELRKTLLYPFAKHDINHTSHIEMNIELGSKLCWDIWNRSALSLWFIFLLYENSLIFNGWGHVLQNFWESTHSKNQSPNFLVWHSWVPTLTVFYILLPKTSSPHCFKNYT